MRATGIVRRIDELGRVVIPMEIRKTLRLKEGDPLEIFTDKNEIRFKKYSPLGSLERLGDNIATSLHEATEKIVLVVDSDMVVLTKGVTTREFERRRISEEVEEILKDGKPVINRVDKGDELIDVVEIELNNCLGQIIIPIIVAGNAIGALILLAKSKNKSVPITDEDIKLTEFAANFLAKQLA